MKRTLFLLAAAMAVTSPAEDNVDVQKIPGKRVFLQREYQVKAFPDPKVLDGRDVLARFSVTPSGSELFFVSGKVISSNTGSPKEMVPILFGPTSKPPWVGGSDQRRWRVSIPNQD